MLSAPLDGLLALLSSGNELAAQRAFLEYEPLLRQAVRRNLPSRFRTRFDSADIVQSVWVSVLRGFREAGDRFTDLDHLKAFLLRVTRNRLIDRLRQHGKTLNCQESLIDDEGRAEVLSAQPQPAECLQAEDLWERMLALCPPEHHELLRLRREGHSLAEVAVHTGLHGDSVRRILRTLARRVAFEQEGVAAPLRSTLGTP